MLSSTPVFLGGPPVIYSFTCIPGTSVVLEGSSAPDISGGLGGWNWCFYRFIVRDSAFVIISLVMFEVIITGGVCLISKIGICIILMEDDLIIEIL